MMRFKERVDVTIKNARTGIITFSPTACSAGLPYPPLRVSGINRRDANILKDLYAGQISEFTADNSFRYQFLVTKKSNPVFSRILHCVQANEEFHVRNVARLITMLGGNPKYNDSKGKPWNATFDIYGTNLRDRLKGDIAAEKAIIKLYEETERKLTDPGAKRFIQRQALDDVFHLELFQETLRRLNNGTLTPILKSVK